MHVVVNQRFLDKRTLIMRLGFGVGLGVFAIGVVTTLVMPQLTELVPLFWLDVFIYSTLIIGFFAYTTAIQNHRRWVRRPREDEVIATYGLRGLDNRYWLLNYMPKKPGSSDMLAGHILVGPSGIHTLHVRPQRGQFVNKGNRWSLKPGLRSFLRSLFEGGVGNPTLDALHEARNVYLHLAAALGEEEARQMPILPVIIFTDPGVQLEVSEPVVPVLRLSELRNYVRKQQKETRLNADQLRRIADVFGLG